MPVQPTVEFVPPTKLVGIGERMSLGADATASLWRALMPRRGEIRNRVSSDYVSMRIYTETALARMFRPDTVFEKWAAVEVADHDAVPDGMRGYEIEGGTYAVFVHEGPASRFPETMRTIFGTWLPTSGYRLDDREHFERVPEGWDPFDDRARESIYVPIAGP